MKNAFKLGAVAVVLSLSVVACGGGAKTSTVDSTSVTKVDTTVKVDSTAKMSTDTTKKDTTKKM